ncbi:Fic family protein [Pseudactinotalea suaedae]|jgi:Fic family protein|uniref:Fic family protein n=1 Tax=Pseudactinotalea suaedae TaxID=1524924 RepID=UPI0012E2C513|nr:Fic family protein [Pseudactinotalea suaedae]
METEGHGRTYPPAGGSLVATTIPAVTYEEHTWVAADDGMTSRRQRAAGTGTYRSALTPRIAAIDPRLPGELAADAEEAAAVLARFDAYTIATLGQDAQTLGPMSAVLLRTESASSSEIENITVGVRQLALAELAESRSANARTVIGNVHAMEAALALAGRLDTDAILGMHRALLSTQRGWEQHAGQLREQLVWIGTRSPVTAQFVPPQHHLVPDALTDLTTFMAREDLPVIAQAAIAHAQFETIHPFVDGNGRTGRALVGGLLRGKEILRSTIAPVSAGLLRDPDGYFAALTAYRTGDIAPIIARFSEASRYAATSGTTLVDALLEQVQMSREQLGRVRPQSHAWSVLPHLVSNPVVNSRLLKQRLGVNDVAVQRALSTLTERGVLRESTGQSRNRVWVHQGILEVLEDYATAIRRA